MKLQKVSQTDLLGNVKDFARMKLENLVTEKLTQAAKSNLEQVSQSSKRQSMPLMSADSHLQDYMKLMSASSLELINKNSLMNQTPIKKRTRQTFVSNLNAVSESKAT